MTRLSSPSGTEKDIKPFVDHKFENNIIPTGKELLAINTWPKNPDDARNLNACVIGSSGSGKTRFWLIIAVSSPLISISCFSV